MSTAAKKINAPGDSHVINTLDICNFNNLKAVITKYFSICPADSLTTLITDDSRLKNAATAKDAYSESWALTYFLLKTKSKQYVAYLEDLRNLAPLVDTPPRDRIAMFKRHFGDDLQELDKEFINYIRRQR